MTEDEKRQQKAMLLLQYEETRQELEHLRAKAWDISEKIKEIAHWLEHSREIMGPSDDFRTKELVTKIERDLPSYREIFQFDSISQLRDELKKTNKRLRELAEQKKALGLGS